MARPRIADLFCGAGGAGMGLHRAGFEVVGFDIVEQPRYPFEFHEQDAFTVDVGGFDAVWASPPCQVHSRFTPNRLKGRHYDFIPSIRSLLDIAGVAYIIENVPAAKTLRRDCYLQGAHFGSRLHRPRYFESNRPICGLGHIPYLRPVLHMSGSSRRRPIASADALRAAMQTPWMTKAEMGQAIPPVYSEYLGKQLLAAL